MQKSQFEIVANKIKALCICYKLPLPIIKPATVFDLCDFTSPGEIRLNIDVAGNIDSDYYAKHVFAHYLCDLHTENDQADMVADVIAGIIDIAGG